MWNRRERGSVSPLGIVTYRVNACLSVVSICHTTCKSHRTRVLILLVCIAAMSETLRQGHLDSQSKPHSQIQLKVMLLQVCWCGSRCTRLSTRNPRLCGGVHLRNSQLWGCGGHGGISFCQRAWNSRHVHVFSNGIGVRFHACKLCPVHLSEASREFGGVCAGNLLHLLLGASILAGIDAEVSGNATQIAATAVQMKICTSV